jgi:hypothetical protein
MCSAVSLRGSAKATVIHTSTVMPCATVEIYFIYNPRGRTSSRRRQATQRLIFLQCADQGRPLLSPPPADPAPSLLPRRA